MPATLTCPRPQCGRSVTVDATPGSTVRCAAGHEFAVPVYDADVYAVLDALGARIGSYTQTAHIAALPGQALRTQMADGFCEGAVLNWLRRALFSGGGRRKAAAPATPGQGGHAALAQLKAAGDNLTAVRSAAIASVNAKRQEEHGRYTRNHAALGAKYTADEITEQQYLAATAELTARTDAFDSRATHAVETIRSAPEMQSVWPTIAREMDDRHREARRTAGQSETLSRAFSNMVVVRAADPATHRGVPTVVATALRHTAAGQGVSINFRPPTQGSTGHAVGVIRLNTGDQYLLFEPNYGVWGFRGAGNLLKALKFVFCTAYPNLGGALHRDAHVYEINGVVEASYTVFASAIAPPHATVAPSLPPQPPSVR
jgi:hypothetical protein